LETMEPELPILCRKLFMLPNQGAGKRRYLGKGYVTANGETIASADICNGDNVLGKSAVIDGLQVAVGELAKAEEISIRNWSLLHLLEAKVQRCHQVVKGQKMTGRTRGLNPAFGEEETEMMIVIICLEEGVMVPSSNCACSMEQWRTWLSTKHQFPTFRKSHRATAPCPQYRLGSSRPDRTEGVWWRALGYDQLAPSFGRRVL